MWLFFIDTVAAIPGKLLYRVVIGENIAVNATQKRNGDFQDWNKQMIRRFADWPSTLQRPNVSTSLSPAGRRVQLKLGLNERWAVYDRTLFLESTRHT
jgi:hypothetical protein